MAAARIRALGRGLTAALAGAFLVAPASTAAPAKAPPAPAQAPPPASIDPAKVNRWIDERMGPEGRAGKLGPAVIVVVDGGKVIAQRAYGFEDRRTKRPVSFDRSVFRLASISKVFTATAIAQLVENGRIKSIDDPVNLYLKRIRIPRNQGREITIRQLLTHTAGFEDSTFGFYTRSEERTLKDGSKIEPYLPGFARPAGGFIDYNNFGAAILGLAIEDVSGLSYAEYLKQHIFTPLGMTGARVLTPRSLHAPNLVTSEKLSASARAVPMSTLAPSPLLAPAASVAMPASDMVRFILAASRRETDSASPLLRAQAQVGMFKPLAADDPAMMAVGQAWFTYLWAGERVVEHGGDLAGAHSMLTLIPDRHGGIFISMASEGASRAGSDNPFFVTPRQINNDLLASIFGPRRIGEGYDKAVAEKAARRPHLPPEEIAADTLNDYVGRYVVQQHSYHRVGSPPGVITVVNEGGTLEIKGLGPLREVRPGLFAGPNKFIFDAIAFQRAPDGSMLLIPYFPVSVFRKVSFWNDPDYAILLFQASLLVSATALVTFFYRDPRRPARTAKLLIAGSFGLSVLATAAAALPIWGGLTLGSSFELGNRTGFAVLIILAHLLLINAAAVTWFVVKAWRERFWGGRWWGRIGRTHYSLLAVAAWAPLPLFLHMHLLGWHLP